MQSRYYDPSIGRFINADFPEALGADLQNLAQYNLFTYCFNHPSDLQDSAGAWPKWIKKAVKAVAKVVTQVKAVLSIPSTVAKIAVASTIAVVSGNATLKDVWTDIKNYDFFNQDEQKCIDAKVFSSYNGTPVLKHSVDDLSSFSFSNTIFLKESHAQMDDAPNTIKHEWGHTVQESLVGTPKYLTKFAIPSIIGYLSDPGNNTYYSLPWERSADFFGGAKSTSTYRAGSSTIAILYFLFP